MSFTIGDNYLHNTYGDCGFVLGKSARSPLAEQTAGPPDPDRQMAMRSDIANEGAVRPRCVVPSSKDDVTLEIARHAVGIVAVSANKCVGVGLFELRGLPAPSESFQH